MVHKETQAFISKSAEPASWEGVKETLIVALNRCGELDAHIGQLVTLHAAMEINESDPELRGLCEQMSQSLRAARRIHGELEDAARDYGRAWLQFQGLSDRFAAIAETKGYKKR